jgi:hypothetical protein
VAIHVIFLAAGIASHPAEPPALYNGEIIVLGLFHSVVLRFN